jgi:hypothetical protein
MLARARDRLRYWNERAHDFLGGDSHTVYAAEVLTRSYERLAYRVEKARDYLTTC